MLSTSAHSSNIYQKGLDGKTITVEGNIHDVPRFHSGYGGQYQSYTFRVNAAPTYKHGDEFISVTFHTVKWGKAVGTFSYKKGDRVTLIGKYREFQGARKSGIVGSLQVNDLSIQEVKGK